MAVVKMLIHDLVDGQEPGAVHAGRGVGVAVGRCGTDVAVGTTIGDDITIASIRASIEERLADDYRPVLEDEGRAFNVDFAPDVHVHGDATLLTQMFVNLLENALHYTPLETPVTLKLSANDDGCRVLIEDGGPGIPVEERARVFKRFVRLDAARSSRGSGLGLALVAAVADLHDIVVTLGDAGPGLRVQLDFTKEQNA